MLERADSRGGASPSPEVIVVGAGIVGLCTAFFLRRRNFSVTVVDPEEPGRGCSAGNAGSISPGSVAPLGLPGVIRSAPRMALDPNGPLSVPPASWLSSAPWLFRFLRASRPESVEAISVALKQLLAPAIDRHREVLEQIGGLDLLRTTGQLHVYPTRSAMMKDAYGWELRRRRGVEVCEVDYDRIRELEPHIGPSYAHGYFLPEQGMTTNPARHAALLAAALRKTGVSFVRDEAVGLLTEGRAVTGLRCRSRDLAGGPVVLCAGAWSGRFLSRLGCNVPLTTQRGYHVHFRGSPISLQRPVVAADRKVFATAMEDGLRLAGTVEFGSLDAPPTRRRAKLLVEHGARLFPQLGRQAEYTEWMGHRPCLPDSLPIVGPAVGFGGLVLNFGHGHLGLTLSAVCGDLVARLICNEAVSLDLAPYNAARFRT